METGENITALNYSAHAIESMKEVVSVSPFYSIHQRDPYRQRYASQISEIYPAQLRRAA
ncbi:hypothetical protein [Brucella anthropi]|uniref:hypothetical protein n=1 Tax=Brucella anthropi TaxID=529 RepID=UPI003EDFB5D7